MKKLFTLVAIAGLAFSTIGCAKPAAPPAAPAADAPAADAPAAAPADAPAEEKK